MLQNSTVTKWLALYPPHSKTFLKEVQEVLSAHAKKTLNQLFTGSELLCPAFNKGCKGTM